MGRHVFLITAYEDFTWLRQVLQVYTMEADCFLHIDKKSRIPEEFLQWIKTVPEIHLYSRYKINWGSYKHISAILLLMKEAVKTGKYEYFHLVSANSFVTRPLNQVLSYFEKTPEKIYMEVIDLEETDRDRVIEPWYIYYHFLHIYDKRSHRGNQFDYYFCKLQKKLGIRRKPAYRYKGLVYCHLPRRAIEYALSYLKKNPGYFRRLKTCNIPEEFFFQNMFMESDLRENIYPSHLLYDKWDEAGKACFLTLEDYSSISQGEYLFARKFGKDSRPLFEKICAQMKKDVKPV